jgi:hypothetical protein
LGVGPEIHFLGKDREYLYMASKDVGCTEDPTVRVKSYNYKTVVNNSALLGVDASTFDGMVQEDKVNAVVVEGLVLGDLICRLFGITDVVTYFENIYFVCDKLGRMAHFKIIDFDTPPLYMTYMTTPIGGLFDGFLGGNGPHRFLFPCSSDGIIRYFLTERDMKARVRTARKAFLPRVDAILGAIDCASRDVNVIIYSVFQEQLFPYGGLLDMYTENIKANVEKFASALRDYSP